MQRFDLQDILRSKITLEKYKTIELQKKFKNRKERVANINEYITQSIDGDQRHKQVIWNPELKDYEEVYIDLFRTEEEKNEFNELRRSIDYKEYSTNFKTKQLKLINMIKLSGDTPFVSFDFTIQRFEFNNYVLKTPEKFEASFLHNKQYITENVLLEQYRYDSKLVECIKSEILNFTSSTNNQTLKFTPPVFKKGKIIQKWSKFIICYDTVHYDTNKGYFVYSNRRIQSPYAYPYDYLTTPVKNMQLGNFYKTPFLMMDIETESKLSITPTYIIQDQDIVNGLSTEVPLAEAET